MVHVGIDVIRIGASLAGVHLRWFYRSPVCVFSSIWVRVLSFASPPSIHPVDRAVVTVGSLRCMRFSAFSGSITTFHRFDTWHRLAVGGDAVFRRILTLVQFLFNSLRRLLIFTGIPA